MTESIRSNKGNKYDLPISEGGGEASILPTDGRAAQRKAAIDKALEGAAAEPDFDARAAAKKALAKSAAVK